MFLVATIGVAEIAIVAVAIAWIALAGRRRSRCCSPRTPLTLVAIASIVGGLWIFAHRSADWHHAQPSVARAVRSHHSSDYVRSDDVHERMARRIEQRVEQHVRQLEQRLEGIPDDHLEQLESRIEQHTQQLEQRLNHIPDVVVTANEQPAEDNEPDANRLAPSVDSQWRNPRSLPVEEFPSEVVKTFTEVPRWMLIALGTVLVIGGWMLVNRDRASPRALKAVTLLGVGATCFILFSLFHSDGPRRITRSHDRVVKISSDEQENTSSEAASATPTASHAARASQPIHRAQRPVPRDVSIEDMPARAGGIPLDEKPATPAAATETVAASQEPGKAEQPAPAAVTEPSKTHDKKRSRDRGFWHEVWAAASEAIDEALESNREEAERLREKLADSLEEARERIAEERQEAREKRLEEAEDAREKKREKLAEAREKKLEEMEDAAAKDSNRAVAIASDTRKDADSDTKNDAKQKAKAAPPALAGAAETHKSETAPATPPDWVDIEGQLVDSVYRVSVKSGLYVDPPECRGHLEATAKQRVDEYIEDYLGEGAANLVNIDRDYIDQVIKKDEYSEVEQRPSWPMPMHQIYALLEIDDAARTTFQEKWRKAIVNERLWQVGSGVAVVLALLSTFYGYLKLDGQTGGTHKGKLQLAATLLALVVAAGALLARWAVPF